eukprot:TRINITY_DN903_c0_g1_i1.p1 TRINITY_DN903_c0_g1~~TRINITY_DN903_c0_g1_i1.p1  ORF type:complete len:183 (+),score=17.27 TRINITY_DN903_c0_g1_i1:914-1462(+)
MEIHMAGQHQPTGEVWVITWRLKQVEAGKTELDYLMEALRYVQELQRKAGVKNVTRLNDWTRIVGDSASSNSGVLNGLWVQFDNERRKEFDELGLGRLGNVFSSILMRSCQDHVACLVETLVQQRLGGWARSRGLNHLVSMDPQTPQRYGHQCNTQSISHGVCVLPHSNCSLQVGLGVGSRR